MSTRPSSDPNAKYVPPDPGGRSRYLIRAIAIACIVGAILAAVLILVLRQSAPPATPQQQPGSNSSLRMPGSCKSQRV